MKEVPSMSQRVGDPGKANDSIAVMNVSKGTTLCAQARMANTFFSRLIGLLGRPQLLPGTGILIEPCSSIHTCGMAFAIDVVALDKHCRVIATWEHVRPWRFKIFSREARRVLEVPSGTLERAMLDVGDQLALTKS
jgi:uncharacterized membrane protein (UPF0127 family)